MGAQISKLNAPVKRRKRRNTQSCSTKGSYLSSKESDIIESSKVPSQKKYNAIRQTGSAGALRGEAPTTPTSMSYPSIPRRSRASPVDRTAAPSTSFREDTGNISTPSFTTENSNGLLSIASTRSGEQLESGTNDLDFSQFLDPNFVEQEYNRQLRQHYVFKQVIGGNIKYDFESPPQTIFDSACGGGFWVFEVAQMFPTSKVIAMNVTVPSSLSQQTGTIGVSSRLVFPNNVSFVHGDIQILPLPFPDNTFDLVHQREAGISLSSLGWRSLIADFHRILKPGGVIHLVEYDLCYPSCGPLSRRVNEAIERLTADRGVDIYHTKEVEKLLHQQGFEDIKVQGFPVPIGEWPKDETKRQQGFLLKSMVLGLLKWTKPNLCAFLGIDEENYEQFSAALIDEVETNQGTSEWKVLTARKSL